MRFRHGALLGIVFVLMLSLASLRFDAHGQTVQIDTAQTQLVQAFALVQQADLDGAPPGQIAMLTASLNQALALEENATQLSSSNATRSDYYATRSASLSNSTSTTALSLSNNARRQAFFNQIGTYTIAVGAGLAVALVVMELPRFGGLVRKTRLRRARFD